MEELFWWVTPGKPIKIIISVNGAPAAISLGVTDPTSEKLKLRRTDPPDGVIRNDGQAEYEITSDVDVLSFVTQVTGKPSPIPEADLYLKVIQDEHVVKCTDRNENILNKDNNKFKRVNIGTVRPSEATIVHFKVVS